MGRGEQKQLNQNAETARGLSAAHTAKADEVFSTLAPTLTQQATNPTGFAPSDMANMNTAAQQSLGGSVAGVTGQGNLEAARTRNAGAFQPAIAESGRDGMRRNSQSTLDIQNKNALLKEANRSQGIQGLTGLYGGLDSASLNALGISSDSYSKAAAAYQNPMAAILMASIQAAGQAASGAGKGDGGGSKDSGE